MSETNCDAYMIKLAEIKTVSEIPTTTKTTLETKINELSAINTQIETDITTEGMPTTLVHLDKLILVRIEESRKATLQSALESFIECRKGNIDDIVKSDTYANTLTYLQETKDIEDYVENTVTQNCECLKIRTHLVKKLSKKI